MEASYFIPLYVYNCLDEYENTVISEKLLEKLGEETIVRTIERKIGKKVSLTRSCHGNLILEVDYSKKNKVRAKK